MIICQRKLAFAKSPFFGSIKESLMENLKIKMENDIAKFKIFAYFIDFLF